MLKVLKKQCKILNNIVLGFRFDKKIVPYSKSDLRYFEKPKIHTCT